MHKQADSTNFQLTVTPPHAGNRLDAYLAAQFPEHSRARWQEAVKTGEIRLNDAVVKPKQIIYVGDVVTGGIAAITPTTHSAQEIELDVLYHDDDIIVVNKPIDLVVHPAAGNPDGTLLNALLYHFPENAQLPRGGIVHRLDKDTSGVMVVAHSLRAHTHLVRQLQARTMGRTYLALVHGYLTAGDTIDAPIGRHPRDRVKMAIVASGKPAVTHYRIAERLPGSTLLRVNLETGRTHQIRVHLTAAHYPLVGDQTYNPGYIPKKDIPEPARTALREFPHQALHASELKLCHPADERILKFQAPLPTDYAELLETLRNTEYTDPNTISDWEEAWDWDENDE